MYLKSFDEMKRTSAFFMLKPVNAIYGFIITICVSIIITLIWAIFSPMDDVVKASVLLRPTQSVSSIKCVTSGELYEKNFDNDDFVQSGDLLFSLDTSAYKTELDAYKKEQHKNKEERFIYETLLQTISTEEAPELEKSSNAYIKSSAYITDLKRYKTSIEDIQIKLEREKNKPESLKIPQNIQDLQNQLSQDTLTFEGWKNNQRIQAIEQLKQLQTSQNTIESHLVELERVIKNSTIYAPISGRITEVKKVNIGDYILSGEEIIKIVPQNNESLKAELYVDPSYVARIKVGNKVKIKFPGLPPSRYGQVETEVSLVPPDVTYLSTGTAVFVVEAIITDPTLHTKQGQTAKLLPGITADGRIVTERSTVMQMVLRKLDFIN